jgi:hypothetical protein
MEYSLTVINWNVYITESDLFGDSREVSTEDMLERFGSLLVMTICLNVILQL